MNEYTFNNNSDAIDAVCDGTIIELIGRHNYYQFEDLGNGQCKVIGTEFMAGFIS
jgi:hypothetical protein